VATFPLDMANSDLVVLFVRCYCLLFSSWCAVLRMWDTLVKMERWREREKERKRKDKEGNQAGTAAKDVNRAVKSCHPRTGRDIKKQVRKKNMKERERKMGRDILFIK
jgi:hypothetical protein